MSRRWLFILLGTTLLLNLFGCEMSRTSLRINGIPKDQVRHIQPLTTSVTVHVAEGYANYEYVINDELGKLGYKTVSSAEGRNDVLSIKPTWNKAEDLPSPARDLTTPFFVFSVFTLPMAMRNSANMNFEVSRDGKIVAIYRYAVPYWKIAAIYSPLPIFFANYLNENSMKTDIVKHMTMALHRDMRNDGLL